MAMSLKSNSDESRAGVQSPSRQEPGARSQEPGAGNPKAVPSLSPKAAPGQQRALRVTAFGLRPSFGVRTSDFGLHATHHAFTLVEILVTVSLLTFIVLGLMAMFQQTQRAFRTGMTQTDVLESGRSLTDMMLRDLEQVTPSQSPRTTNFIAEVAFPARLDGAFLPAVTFQDLPGTQTNALQQRLNLFYDFFFLTRQNQTWTAIGYIVDTPASGVGTLYRWQETTNTFYLGNILSRLSSDFDDAAHRLYYGDYYWVTNPNPTLRRVADGVVNLRVKCYSPTGTLITPTNQVLFSTNSWNPTLPLPYALTDFNFVFASNAVPAYVEVEMGLLEDRTLARFRSIPDPKARGQYLTNHSANVHLFRQRIPIRNVDFTAYPAPQ